MSKFDMRVTAHNDGMGKLTENANSGLIGLWQRLPMTEEQYRINFNYYCRQRGTRIARIMDMIEAGMKDREIADKIKCDAAAIKVYRKAYNNELSFIKDAGVSAHNEYWYKRAKEELSGELSGELCPACGRPREDQAFVCCEKCRSKVRDRQRKIKAKERERNGKRAADNGKRGR